MIPKDRDSARREDSIHLTLRLNHLEAIDLVSLFQLACDQGQYGEAQLIRAALLDSLDDYCERTQRGEADAEASDDVDEDDDEPGLFP